MVAQLILGLSILVGIHEFGHMITAKMFGMRVEKFSIGFPPKIFGVKFGETEYSLGAVPLGGFVKISGMIDESLDTESMSKEPEPYEFRSKPAWQRLIVMLGGVIMNVLLGIFIFILLLFNYGEPYLPKDVANIHGLVPTELGMEIGFKEGDKVLTINGEDYKKFSEITGSDAILADEGYYEVERDGNVIRLDIPGDFLDKLADAKEKGPFVYALTPFRVGEVETGLGADFAGLKKGDYIVEIDGKKVEYYHHLAEVLEENKNEEVELKYRRNENIVTTKAVISEKGKLGFRIDNLLDYKTTKYSFLASIPKGTTKAFKIITDQVKAFKKILTGQVSASKSLSGPIGIAEIFGSTWDWLNFWTMTALLSMVLAFMNLLPIPALDGGHVIFLLYEIVSGRKPGDKFMEVAQKVGMVVLLGLMAFAIGNDVYKMIVKHFFS